MGKGKKMGVRFKLISLIIPIFIIMVFAFFVLCRGVILELATDRFGTESEVYAEKISAWTGQIISELNIYKNTINEAGFQDDAAILTYLETSCGKNPAYPVGLYMGDDSGVYLDGSGWVPEDDWVLTERDWYLEGVDNEEFAFGEPYYDSQTGDVCVSATVRMDYDAAVRVLAVDVYLDYLSELVTEITEGSIENAFFVTKTTQTILAHPDNSMIDVKLDGAGLDKLYGNVSEAISSGKSIAKLLLLEGKDGKYYVSINEIENTDWYLVTCMKRSDVLKELTRVEIIMILIAVIAAFVLIFVIIRIVNGIVQPVENVTNVLKDVAVGDFSHDIEVKGNDEIANMSRNMQNFLTNMRTTIADISHTADWLSKQSEENGRVSEELADSSMHQSNAVETLNEMVESLSKAAEDVSVHMSELTNVILAAKTECDRAGDIMLQTVDASEGGKRDMQKVSSGMYSIENTIGSLASQIKKAGEVTSNISRMVTLITDIADETNLLSLNASIEAARAGEAGRGFAVVAEQISTLAENSKKAAEDISRLTEEISLTMQEAEGQMEQSVYEVKENAIVVTQTTETFDVVYEKVAETNKKIKHLVELMEKVDKVALDMQETAKEQFEATEQISESAKELENYTQTVSTNSDTAAENARVLETESKSLINRMGQFRV
ncbi:MAG: methyl-accepting chemotaxis protein [Clostridium sp.]|nr:methyl-accepting chemotaxis protein [Clostridium sp.]MCM1207874.1 methyl-accepting chemotaxis protein [Ruminococcus sp.]